MIKKNKKLLATIGLLTGVSVFATTAFVALANNSGYESFKQAIIKTAQMKSFETETKVTVKYKDENVAIGTIIQKTNEDKSYYQTIQSKLDGTVVNDFAFYTDNDSRITYKDGKIESEENGSFNGMHSYNNESKSESLKAAETKLVEVLMDTLVGDSKNFVISNGKKIYADLDETQIPNLAQVSTNLFSEMAKEGMLRERGDQSSLYTENSIESNIRKVAELKDISLKNINIKGEIGDDNYLKNMDISIEVGGTDQASEYVTYTFIINTNISNVGNATVSKPVVANE